MKNKKAFTLVELIVVITILGILGAVGFVGYSGYIKGARDSNRLSQLKGIYDGLEVYKVKESLPLPENSVEIRLSGSVLGYQGYMGENNIDLIGYNKGGKDPKDGTYFSYYLTKDKKYFQLLGYLEEPNDKNLSKNISNTTYALDYNERYPVVYGSKLGILTQKTSNIPIQEISSITGSGYYDFKTSSGEYNSVLSESKIVTGSGLSLYAYIYNKGLTECKEGMTELMLSNGQIWSCMNLGATTVWDGITQPTDCNGSTINCNSGLSWLGDYYQWGRNDTGFTNGTGSAPYNYGWEAQNDSKWGGGPSDTSTSDGVGTTFIGRQGPCPNGWHVPSAKDWQDACNYIVGTTCFWGMPYNSLISSKLKLPFNGYRQATNGVYYVPQAGYYWYSSTFTNNASNIQFSLANIWVNSNSNRATAFNIRCMKN